MEPDWDRVVVPVAGGTQLLVWVVPGSRTSGITGLHGDAVRIRVAAPAEAGRANEAVCRLVAAVTGAPVRLLSGHRGRRKRLLIEGAGAATVRAALRRAVGG